MQVHINFHKRLAAFQTELRRQDVDVLVGTRLKTITHLSGAFVPWRSSVVAPVDDDVQLITIGMDVLRILDEGWLTNVVGYSRHSMMEMVIKRIRELGLEKGRIGVEDGYSCYLPEGTITHLEYKMLEDAFPDATIVNVTSAIDRFMLVKEPEQIQLMRQATALSDAAQEAVRLEARVGMTEAEIAGIAEYTMRNLGSEFAWTFTGGQEVASGYRTWTGACTPSTRKIVQRGEFVVLDLHGMYGLMLGDVSHNAIMGEPTKEQQAVIDAYVQSVKYLVGSLRPGRTIGDVAKDVRLFTVDQGWGKMIRGFGHGIGHFGNEWYPSFTDFKMDYVSEPDYVMEPGFMEIIALTCNLPGIGGLRYERAWVITETAAECMSRTPIEPWVYQDQSR